jgi:hypothetical protein
MKDNLISFPLVSLTYRKGLLVGKESSSKGTAMRMLEFSLRAMRRRKKSQEKQWRSKTTTPTVH